MNRKNETPRAPLSHTMRKLYGWVGDTHYIDTSNISGNVDREVKQTCVKILKYFVGTVEGKVYGAQVGQRFKLTNVNIWGKGDACCAQTTVEVLVEQDMCNHANILHGACAAYIVDPCTVSSLIVLGAELGIDGTGFSQSMNLIWHHAVKRGANLRIASTAMSMRGRIRTARCEIWDENTLCITALHSTVKPGRTRTLVRL